NRDARAFHLFYCSDVLFRQRQVVPIAHHFSVWGFTHHYDADVGAGRARAVFGKGYFGAARGCCLYGFQYRYAALSHVAGLALPRDGPAAALVSDVIRAFATYVNSRECFRKRQGLAIVL